MYVLRICMKHMAHLLAQPSENDLQPGSLDQRKKIEGEGGKELDLSHDAIRVHPGMDRISWLPEGLMNISL